MALAQFIAPLEIPAYGDEAAQYYGSMRAFLENRARPSDPSICLLQPMRYLWAAFSSQITKRNLIEYRVWKSMIG